MQKALFFLIVLIPFTLMQAQDVIDKESTDIIHLKNKKIIQGTIVKDEFGIVSIKVKDDATNKENIHTIQLIDIAKIERATQTAKLQTGAIDSVNILRESGSINVKKKPADTSKSNVMPDNAAEMKIAEPSEQHKEIDPTVKIEEVPIAPIPPTYTMSPQSQSPEARARSKRNKDPFAIPKPKRVKMEWDRQIRGYRGFADYGYILGVGNEKNDRMELSTSHGFQFNPIFFVGSGISYNMSVNGEESLMTIFINPRINFLDNNTTPFWDLKAGYSPIDCRGPYISTAFGVSVSKNNKRSFNLGLGYSFHNVKFKDYLPDNRSKKTTIKKKYGGIALRLSFEF